MREEHRVWGHDFQARDILERDGWFCCQREHVGMTGHKLTYVREVPDPPPPAATFYALWRTTSFPFVLGGKVTELLGNGTVKVQEYGDLPFRPVWLLPEDQGRQLLWNLDQLKLEYADQKKELDRNYDDRAMAIAFSVLK